MNIRKVSYGLIASAMMTGTLAGCTESKFQDRAKAEAAKYLNGYDFLKAERIASQQHNYDVENGNAIVYWDSLLAEAKAKEAYLRGAQVIKDSANHNFFRKEKFNTQLDTIIIPGNIVDEVMQEYSTYTSAEDFIKARENAPDGRKNSITNHQVSSTHYWNLITIAGKQNEAYQKGMEDARKNLKER